MNLWVPLGISVAVIIYVFRKKIKNAILYAHYEAIYWVLGGFAIVDDTVNAKKNVLPFFSLRKDIAVLTGGSRGIGYEVLRKLLQHDMHVIIGCRKVDAGVYAVTRLREEGVMLGTAEVEPLDTSSLTSVKEFAYKVLAKTHKVHILINNAGIMMVPFSLTEDNFESQLAVNYLGHVYLVHYLLPLLKAAGKPNKHSRIVNVSSCAHFAGTINFSDINFKSTPYIPSKAYAQSKLAQLMFSNVLNRLLSAEKMNISSYAVHPGVVNTELFDNTLLKKIAPWALKFFKTPEQGSRSIVYAALADYLEDKGGSYISNCQIAPTSSAAKDVVDQDKLLELTLDLLRLKEIGANLQMVIDKSHEEINKIILLTAAP